MRCNQVSINIERFGKYVPESYPGDIQRIHVYCDDFESVYAALSKAYALAVNELNEYETIGARADVYTNEFSRTDYKEMKGTIPVERRRYEEDVNWEYRDSRLAYCRDYIWVYEHAGELLEVIKECGDSEDLAPALKERFGLDDVQIRKLSKIRLDMLTKEQYESVKNEIQEINARKTKEEEKAESTNENELQQKLRMRERMRVKLDRNLRETTKLMAYMTAAEHFEEIFKAMAEAESYAEFRKTMRERFGFKDEQIMNSIWTVRRSIIICCLPLLPRLISCFRNSAATDIPMRVFRRSFWEKSPRWMGIKI